MEGSINACLPTVCSKVIAISLVVVTLILVIVLIYHFSTKEGFKEGIATAVGRTNIHASSMSLPSISSGGASMRFEQEFDMGNQQRQMSYLSGDQTNALIGIAEGQRSEGLVGTYHAPNFTSISPYLQDSRANMAGWTKPASEIPVESILEKENMIASRAVSSSDFNRSLDEALAFNAAAPM